MPRPSSKTAGKKTNGYTIVDSPPPKKAKVWPLPKRTPSNQKRYTLSTNMPMMSMTQLILFFTKVVSPAEVPSPMSIFYDT